MSSDDLNAPLGQEPGRGKRKQPSKLTAAAPQILAGALGLFGLLAVTWALVVNDPLGGEPVAVRIITAADFVALNQLTGREIALLKMDIEGAETEVFENFQSIAGILAVTRCFLIEIHDGANVPAITNRLAVAGFVFQERRGINFLFQRAG